MVRLPAAIYRYVLGGDVAHQLGLVLLTVTVFLLEVVPLELQRRIINDLVKNREFGMVVELGAAYAAVVLVQGSTKLVLNVYRGWVGERAKRDLRRRIRSLEAGPGAAALPPEAQGIEASMIVAEVEPIGSFVGSCLSEPVLQAGILLSVMAYVVHLDPWMALSALVLFLPQLIFVPVLQRAINRRTGARVWLLRQLGISVIAGRGAAHPGDDQAGGDDHSGGVRPGGVRPGGVRQEGDRPEGDTPEGDPPGGDPRIDRIFDLDMGIFRLKFTMNFLMNLCNHLQIVAALVLGGWLVTNDQLEIGGVVAFISAIGRLNDPWGDLVNYFRDLSVNQVKFRLVSNAINRLAEGRSVEGGDEI